ncbi:hypothetical protein BRYFOR_09393 [Marvinbryantia formatexigens DSM 14469]|uniref:Uncharacterized protein n=1 Tax=Marvinbryantia formatexigens DSM 14469 TaxID=478749 RepID=C6LL46_9FIRM|nr:hypothetical protein BRYFOR_09393 [Marvinbryantia formatexigens DSM 14469]
MEAKLLSISGAAKLKNQRVCAGTYGSRISLRIPAQLSVHLS